MANQHQIPVAITAKQLIASGKVRDAIVLLNEAAKRGSADAVFEIGTLQLEGQHLSRDYARIRSTMQQAARLGHREAAFIHASMLCSGVGGDEDWAACRAALKQGRGNSRVQRATQLLDKMSLDQTGDPVDRAIAADRISEQPWVMRFPQFATPEECRYLIETAQPRMAPTEIIDTNTGEMRISDLRTAHEAAFYAQLEDPVVHAINRRIAVATGTRAEQGEPLTVLRYLPGQEFKPHMDYIPNEPNQRILTFILYLSTDYTGGETMFYKHRLAVKGAVGTGIAFRNVLPDGRADNNSLHAGTPVLEGTKFIATRWIRADRHIQVARAKTAA